MEQCLLLEAKRRKRSVMVGSRGAEFVIYFESGGSLSISDYIDAAEDRLRGIFPGLLCYWGISESYSERTDFARIYKNAVAALRYCINVQKKSRRFTY